MDKLKNYLLKVNDPKKAKLRILIARLKTILIAILCVVFGTIFTTYQGDLFSFLKEEIVNEIGKALIIIGLAILFYEQFLREEIIKIVIDELKVIFKENCDFKSIKLLGLDNIFLKEGTNGIIIPAKKNIKLLGITIDSFFNPRSTDFNLLLDKVKEGCKLQILMLNPNSPHVYYRELAEQNDKLKFQIENSFDKKKTFIRAIPEKDKLNVEIRYYNTSPGFAMTIIDDSFARVTPFLYNQMGRNCPTSDFTRKVGGVFQSYLDHFNDLWDAKIFLFNWNKVPGEDTDLLKNFLIKNYGLSCVRDENITKIENGKVIEVVNDKIKVLISLNNNKTKAKLSIECGWIEELIAESKDGEIKIYLGTMNAL